MYPEIWALRKNVQDRVVFKLTCQDFYPFSFEVFTHVCWTYSDLPFLDLQAIYLCFAIEIWKLCWILRFVFSLFYCCIKNKLITTVGTSLCLKINCQNKNLSSVALRLAITFMCDSHTHVHIILYIDFTSYFWTK